jgi:hypothetical protein
MANFKFVGLYSWSKRPSQTHRHLKLSAIGRVEVGPYVVERKPHHETQQGIMAVQPCSRAAVGNGIFHAVIAYRWIRFESCGS